MFVCVRLGGIETDEEERKRESGWESRPSLYLFQPGVLHLISIRAMPIMEEIHYSVVILLTLMMKKTHIVPSGLHQSTPGYRLISFSFCF